MNIQLHSGQRNAERRHCAGRLLLNPLSVILYLLLSTQLTAAPPSWWATRGVLDPNQAQDDRAAVTVGQIKNFAVKAKEEMDARLPGGAGDAIHEMVQTWRNNAADDDQRAAATAGQLKAVAKLFYDRLVEVGARQSPNYPWSESGDAASALALVNAGQVKNVFAFEIPAAAGQIEIVAGNDQFADPGMILPLPLKVRCSTGLQPAAGVVVTFTVAEGAGELRGVQSAAWGPVLAIMSDVNGYAEVMMRMPATQPAGTVCQITASVADPFVSSVVFGATVTGAMPPTGLVAVIKEGGMVELTWEPAAGDTGDAFTVERRALKAGAVWHHVSNGGVTGYGNVVNSYNFGLVRRDDPYYLDAFPMAGVMEAASAGFVYRVKSYKTPNVESVPSQEVEVRWDTDTDGLPDWFEMRIIRNRRALGLAPAGTGLEYVDMTTRRMTGTGSTDGSLWFSGGMNSWALAGTPWGSIYYMSPASVHSIQAHFGHLWEVPIRFEVSAGFPVTGGASPAGVECAGFDPPEFDPPGPYAIGIANTIIFDYPDPEPDVYDPVPAVCSVTLPDQPRQTSVIYAGVDGGGLAENFHIYRTAAAEATPPAFAIQSVTGSGQVGDAEQVLPQRLRLRYVAADPEQQAAAANRVFRFCLVSGDARLSTANDPNGLWRTWVETTTDIDGYAEVWCKAPATAGSTATIQAIGGDSLAARTSFSVSAHAAPAAPTEFTCTISGNDLVLSWRDNSSNESTFKIQRSEDRHAAGGGSGAWTDLHVADPGEGSGTLLTWTHEDWTAAGGMWTVGYRYRIAVFGQQNNPSGWVYASPSVVSLNSDNDSLSDWFEWSIINANLEDPIDGLDDVDPEGDFDGDELSNAEEWVRGKDPTVFDPPAFRMEKVAGTGQSNFLPGDVAQPLTVRLVNLNSNLPQVGTAIQFALLNGSGGGLGATADSITEGPLTVITDANGLASAFTQIPVVPGPNAVARVKGTKLDAPAVFQDFELALRRLEGVLTITSAPQPNPGIEQVSMTVRLTDPLTGDGIAGHPIQFNKSGFGGHFLTAGGDWTTSAVTFNTDASGYAQVTYRPPNPVKYDLLLKAAVPSGAYYYGASTQALINSSLDAPLEVHLQAEPVQSWYLLEDWDEPASDLTLTVTRAGVPVKEQPVMLFVESGEGGLAEVNFPGYSLSAPWGTVTQSLLAETDNWGKFRLGFRHPRNETAVAMVTRVRAVAQGTELGTNQAASGFVDITTAPSTVIPVVTRDVLLGPQIRENARWLAPVEMPRRAASLLVVGRRLVFGEEGTSAQLTRYQRLPGAAAWTAMPAPHHTTSLGNWPAEVFLAYDQTSHRVVAARKGTLVATGMKTFEALPDGTLASGPDLNLGTSSTTRLLSVAAAGGSAFVLTKSDYGNQVVSHCIPSEQNWATIDPRQITSTPLANLAAFGASVIYSAPYAMNSHILYDDSPPVEVYDQRTDGGWGLRGVQNDASEIRFPDWLLNGFGDYAGSSVAMTSGLMAIAGNPTNEVAMEPFIEKKRSGQKQGGVTLYRQMQGSWNRIQDLHVLAGYDTGRIKLAFDGDRLAIAAYGAHACLGTTVAHMDDSSAAARGGATAAPPEGTPVEKLWVATYRPTEFGTFELERTLVDQESFSSGATPVIAAGAGNVTSGRYRMGLTAGDGIVAVSFPRQAGGMVVIHESLPQVSEDIAADDAILSIDAAELFPSAGGDITLETPAGSAFEMVQQGSSPRWHLQRKAAATIDALVESETSLSVYAKLDSTVLDFRHCRFQLLAEPLITPTGLTATRTLGEPEVVLNWQDDNARETGFEVQYRTTQPYSDWLPLATASARTGTGAASLSINLSASLATQVLQYRVRAVRTGAPSSDFCIAATGIPDPSVVTGGPLDTDHDGVPDDIEILEGTDPEDPLSNSVIILKLVIQTPLQPQS